MSRLEAEQLDIRIGESEVCSHLDLRINSGENWGLLGRNGVGKTTLLHTLAGLRRPDSGDVKLDGTPLSSLSRRSIARYIGVLLQDHQDAFPASVMETVLIGRHPYLGPLQWEGPADYVAATEALHAVELEGMGTRGIATLSGGERRRLGIATLLAQDPHLFLLDEPTNHMDLHHQILILDLLSQRTRAGAKSMLLVLHELNLALRYCDHFLLLYGAGETLQGTAEAVLTQPNLERLYGHPLQALQVPGGTVWLPR
ncbi:MAG: ABC transporter ATP-binding protein [Gammaproteobacteria bacterium]